LTWAKKYDRCLQCGTQTHKHIGRGLCVYCYRTDIEGGHKAHITGGLKDRKIYAKISKDDLEIQYEKQGMSLSDLARKYDCTRQYIYKLMEKYGIIRRDKASARELAYNMGKIIYTRDDDLGINTKVIAQKNIVNREFFNSWSPAMAYVLGVLYTDGQLAPGKKRDPNAKTTSSSCRFGVSQKEPELLEKILALMKSNAKLLFRKKMGIFGDLYSFWINDNEMYEDLLRLGLSPNKSLTLAFPNMGLPYLRHFIRGCWDGDGSVYWEDNDPAKPRASFVTGSKQFAEGILKQLFNLGLSEPRLYTAKDGRSFYFRFLGRDCARLYHIFYDWVPKSMYLTRKYDRFKSIVNYYKDVYVCQTRVTS